MISKLYPVTLLMPKLPSCSSSISNKTSLSLVTCICFLNFNFGSFRISKRKRFHTLASVWRELNSFLLEIRKLPKLKFIAPSLKKDLTFDLILNIQHGNWKLMRIWQYSYVSIVLCNSVMILQTKSDNSVKTKYTEHQLRKWCNKRLQILHTKSGNSDLGVSLFAFKT